MIKADKKCVSLCIPRCVNLKNYLPTRTPIFFVSTIRGREERVGWYEMASLLHAGSRTRRHVLDRVCVCVVASHSISSPYSSFVGIRRHIATSFSAASLKFPICDSSPSNNIFSLLSTFSSLAFSGIELQAQYLSLVFPDGKFWLGTNIPNFETNFYSCPIKFMYGTL